MQLIQSIISWYLKRRLSEIEHFIQEPVHAQKTVFKNLMNKGKLSQYGKVYQFNAIDNYRQFAAQIPLITYADILPFIERITKGEQDVLWPGKIHWMAKSSGTTAARSKFIPITEESLETCHYRGGRDVLACYLNRFPNSKILNGKGIVMGGSHSVSEWNKNLKYGDLSAVLMQNLRPLAKFLSALDEKTAVMENWEEKIDAIIQVSLDRNITYLAGVPSWSLVLLQRVLDSQNVNSIQEVWPEFEGYIHGGVSFTPYENRFQSILDPGTNYFETYNASEGFFALDYDDEDGMLLMLDYGIFYEFIPMSEFHHSRKAIPLEEVELNINYALVISTNCGLWRYVIGDTVKFTSLHPHRIKITGRTRHFINMFGEEVIVENTDMALQRTCKKHHAEIVDYTVAPVGQKRNQSGHHDWLIEFKKAPQNLELFTVDLDHQLQEINSDYAAKRKDDIVMSSLSITVLPKHTFHQYLQQKGKLGGQHKVPRLSTNRDFVEELLDLANE